MDTLRWKFGALQSEYEAIEQARLQGLPPAIELKSESAFRASGHTPQVIGHARVMLNFLYFNLVLKDTYAVISYTGEIVGQVQFLLKPIWRTAAQKKAAYTAESIMDIPDIREGLDLELRVGQIRNIPVMLATDTRVAVAFPEVARTALLPDVNAAAPSAFATDEEAWEQDMVRGASYLSPLSLSGEQEEKVNCNPDIAYKVRLRLAPFTRKVANWLQDGELLLTLFGSNPSPEAMKKHKRVPRGARRPSMVEAEKRGENRLEELARLRTEYQALLPEKARADVVAEVSLLCRHNLSVTKA
jgi:hypothetical protein